MRKNLSEHSKKITPRNLDAWNKQMYRLRVFDELIYDTNANLTNVSIGQCLTSLWSPSKFVEGQVREPDASMVPR
jgi:hypothetical protein